MESDYGERGLKIVETVFEYLKECFIRFPKNTLKLVEKMRPTHLKMFENRIKHSSLCLIYKVYRTKSSRERSTVYHDINI